MSGYLNSLFNTTASRVASIKQNLLPSENDGDTEDDTHICRVLRVYYTEKGRAFPAWLPPDPRAPPPVVVQPVYAQPVGSRYGGLPTQPGGSGALSSLWDSQPQQAPPQDQQSLRHGRGPSQNRLAPSGGPQRQNPYARQQSAQELPVQARPLPSQRAGSYQTASGGPFGRGDAQTPPGSSGGGARTTADRLKEKFSKQPPRANSPTTSTMMDTRSSGQDSQYRPAGRESNRDDRSMRSGGGGAEKPLVYATSPWANNESEFSGGGYGGGGGGYGGGGGGGGGSGGGRQGLPGGPGAGRRGPGLPTGPRGPR